LKKTRVFEGWVLRYYKQQSYWQAVGSLRGGLKVFVVRYRRKYDATNRLTFTAPEVRRLYRKRHEVEEVIKVLNLHSALLASGLTCGRMGAFSSPLRLRCFHGYTAA